MIPFKALSVPALLILAACAQPEPVPEPITPEPIFDKWGNDISPDNISPDSGGCTGSTGSNCIPPPPPPGGQTFPDQDGGGGNGDGDGGNGDGGNGDGDGGSGVN